MEKIITIKPVYVGVAPCSYCEGGQRKQEEERVPDVVNGSGKEKKKPSQLGPISTFKGTNTVVMASAAPIKVTTYNVTSL